MVIVNTRNYLEKNATKKGTRDWWFPTYNLKGQLVVPLNQIVLPKSFEGKKVQFRVEILGENKLIFENGKKEQEKDEETIDKGI